MAWRAVSLDGALCSPMRDAAPAAGGSIGWASAADHLAGPRDDATVAMSWAPAASAPGAAPELDGASISGALRAMRTSTRLSDVSDDGVATHLEDLLAMDSSMHHTANVVDSSEAVLRSAHMATLRRNETVFGEEDEDEDPNRDPDACRALAEVLTYLGSARLDMAARPALEGMGPAERHRCLAAQLRAQRVQLPLVGFAAEQAQMVEAHSAAHACARGAWCRGIQGEIRIEPPDGEVKDDVGGAEARGFVLRGFTPPGGAADDGPRLCVLCLRAHCCVLLMQLTAMRDAADVGTDVVHPVHRVGVDQPDGYRRDAVFVPGDGRWDGFGYAPVVRYEPRRLAWRLDDRAQPPTWYVDQSDLAATFGSAAEADADDTAAMEDEDRPQYFR